MCDLAYLLLVEQLERQVIADRQIVATYNASGHFEDRPLPNFYEVRQQFDAALVEEPSLIPVSVADLEQMELRQALGVA